MEIVHCYVWFHQVHPENSHKIGMRYGVKIEGPPSQEIWTHTVSSASLTLVSSSDSNISHETQAFCEWVGYQQIPFSTCGKQSETDCCSICLSKESGKSTNPKLHRSTPRVSLCHWPKRGGTAARPSDDLPSCEMWIPTKTTGYDRIQLKSSQKDLKKWSNFSPGFSVSIPWAD